MAEARARLRKEAEEEKTFIRGLGFCSFGVGSTRATVGVKNGKMSRIRRLRYDWKYEPEAFNRWNIEAKVLTEQWRKEYNQVCPHSSLHYRPPASEARISAILT
jgi:transposase InsO family protein